MIKSGTLFIDSQGFSRLNSTLLMKGALNNGGFGRATNFLQGRGLNSGPIFVDGVDDTFGGPVIVITNAGRPPAPSGPVPQADAFARRASGKKGAKASQKRRAKKGAGGKGAKKAGAKKTAGQKSGAKKSGAKKAGAKKAAKKSGAKKSAKKSGAKKSNK
jgi:hypothetical protein